MARKKNVYRLTYGDKEGRLLSMPMESDSMANMLLKIYRDLSATNENFFPIVKVELLEENITVREWQEKQDCDCGSGKLWGRCCALKKIKESHYLFLLGKNN